MLISIYLAALKKYSGNSKRLTFSDRVQQILLGGFFVLVLRQVQLVVAGVALRQTGLQRAGYAYHRELLYSVLTAKALEPFDWHFAGPSHKSNELGPL